MINLSKSGNTIVFEFVNNGHYLQNGTIEVPVNSLTLVTDGSDMFTFKKSATNDIFVSGLYSEIGMTKSELETFYKENMVGSTGGSGGVTSGEVQSMIDESISGKADTSAVTEDISAAVSGKADKSKAYGSYQFGESSNQPYIRYKSVSSQNLGNEIYYAKINGKGTLTSNGTWAKNNLNFQLVETSAFTAYTASTDSRIAEDEEVTAAAFNEIEGRIAEDEEVTAAAFNEIEGRIAEDEEVTAAAFNALNEEISGKVETSAFTAYSATVETALSGKQDTLSAGTNITISGNVISAEGGSITVDTALDSGSTNPVENRVIYNKFDEVEQVTAAALNALNDTIGNINSILESI